LCRPLPPPASAACCCAMSCCHIACCMSCCWSCRHTTVAWHTLIQSYRILVSPLGKQGSYVVRPVPH
jgi:hypothetical protein